MNSSLDEYTSTVYSSDEDDLDNVIIEKKLIKVTNEYDYEAMINSIIIEEDKRSKSSANLELNGSILSLSDLANKLSELGFAIAPSAKKMRDVITDLDFKFQDAYDYFIKLNNEEQDNILNFYGLKRMNYVKLH